MEQHTNISFKNLTLRMERSQLTTKKIRHDRISLDYQTVRMTELQATRMQLHIKMSKMLGLFMLFCCLLFGLCFAGKYMMTSSRYYYEEEQCVEVDVNFNGWDFEFACLGCNQGYVLESHGKGCIPNG